jgi:hypothetical protein
MQARDCGMSARPDEGRAAERLATELMGWLTTVRNITTHPAVGFHRDGAEVLDEAPPGLMSTYLAKYGQLIREQVRTTLDQLEAEYSATIWITPRRTRAW